MNNLATYLGNLGQLMALPNPGFNPEAPQVAGVEQAPPPLVQPAPVGFERPGGLRNFLGNLGDALLMGAGADPIYNPKMQERELGAAMAAYMGADNPALAEIIRQNPAVGRQLANDARQGEQFDRQFEQRGSQFDRTAGQRDREISERERSNRVSEGLTDQGQRISAQTRMSLAELQQRSAAADRAMRLALQQGDQAFAREMLESKQTFDREIATLAGGGGQGTVTETVTYPGEEARTEGGFLGFGGTEVPATPERRIVTERPVAAQPSGPSQADLEYTAQKHGITVEEVRQRLGL